MLVEIPAETWARLERERRDAALQAKAKMAARRATYKAKRSARRLARLPKPLQAIAKALGW